jgi:hypothetical protein
MADSAGQTVEDDSPEARMARRYPQPVEVGTLKRYPFTEFDRRVVGEITAVSKTPAGKIQLIILLSWRFGWTMPRRLIAVPIELVGIRGTEVVALDINLEMVRASPTWAFAPSTLLGDKESILIALAKS